MGGQKGPDRNAGRREEERLLSLAGRAVGSDFPNPERAECPGPDALKALARRRLSKLKTDDLVDHVASCAPCFIEYTRYRKEHWQRTIVGLISTCVLFAIAAALILRFSGVAPWFVHRPVTQTAQIEPSKAVLDLRDSSPARSGDAPNTAAPKSLSKNDLDLTIQLPIGTDDGEYLVEMRPAGGRMVVTARGVANWNGTSEELRTHLDLRAIPADEYGLTIQKEGDASRRTYPVIVR